VSRAIERLAQHTGGVSVEFGDGTSGDDALVVAADGVNSTIGRLALSRQCRGSARGSSRLALSRAQAFRGHRLVGDARAPDGILDPSDR
jgi:2-polyprenyl-6-methoxyphenol hydroxylase-like FAD-dependent oxidoreductase